MSATPAQAPANVAHALVLRSYAGIQMVLSVHLTRDNAERALQSQVERFRRLRGLASLMAEASFARTRTMDDIHRAEAEREASEDGLLQEERDFLASNGITDPQERQWVLDAATAEPLPAPALVEAPIGT